MSLYRERMWRLVAALAWAFCAAVWALNQGDLPQLTVALIVFGIATGGAVIAFSAGLMR